ncbi:MAG: thioredoxin domain-containing protein, partial [Actinomycetota bacterium]
VIARSFDAEWGGFGGAPKFPQPMTIEFLLRMHARGVPGALDVARRTLDKMARGGMFDQVGGGFHRYAVDRVWLVPHFEKMLYDNAQLLRVYTRAWQVTRSDLYRDTARATAAYLVREMRHPAGGFFSSQDADSEGVEGKFYVWSYDELAAVAGEDARAVAAFYSASPQGNWEGTNVLWRPRDDDVVAVEQGLSVAELLAAVERARGPLFEVRSKRVPPATDDKVLASWNGLAITALAEAGRVLGDAALIDAATDAARFVLTELRDASGRLQRSWREGRTSGPAYLDDHALLASACLDLYETTFDETWFVEASRLIDDAIRLFADDAGGFFDTGSDVPALVVRPKDFFDNAVPAGNSVMAEVLLRMAAFTGNEALEARALSIVRALGPAMVQAPTGFGYLMSALDLALSRAKEIAISTNDTSSAETQNLTAAVWGRYLPNRVLAVGRTDGTAVPLLKDRPTRDGLATAYVCERFVCGAPVTDPADLAAQLS